MLLALTVAVVAAYVVTDQWAFRCQRVAREIVSRCRATTSEQELFRYVLPRRYVVAVWIGRLLFAVSLVLAWQTWRWYGVVPLCVYALFLGAVLDLLSPWPSRDAVLRLCEAQLQGVTASPERTLCLFAIRDLRRGRETAADDGAVITPTTPHEAVSERRRRARRIPEPSAPLEPPGSQLSAVSPRVALNEIISAVASIDTRLSGDSPLANPWEEIKDQLQHERSIYWPAYLDVLRQFVSGYVQQLDDEDLRSLKDVLKCSSRVCVERRLLRRLLARGNKEPISYTPFEFQYFCYPLLGFTAYGEVLRRTGFDQCDARVFSIAAPSGEIGTVDSSVIEEVLSPEEFEEARVCGWPKRS